MTHVRTSSHQLASPKQKSGPLSSYQSLPAMRASSATTSNGTATDADDESLQMLFIGTGTSTGLPLTPCLTLSASYPERWHETIPLSHVAQPPKGAWHPTGEWPTNIPCSSCRAAVDKDVPEGWKNRRGNTSVMLRKKDKQGKWKNVLVDVGKTFREQAAKLFPAWGVQTVDAVVLTHGHADAYFGLDDLREWCMRLGTAIPVYLNKPTYEAVAASFPYLVDKSFASGGGDVPTLRFHVVDDYAREEICGIDVKFFPVYHGIYFRHPEGTPADQLEPAPLICLSFVFDDSVAYVGDVSEIPDESWKLLESSGKPVSTPTVERLSLVDEDQADAVAPTNNHSHCQSQQLQLPILVIDALWPIRSHISHFGLKQAFESAHRLRPANTYFLGFTHPTTHYMWEELCLSLSGEDGQREHPEKELAQGLVKKFWATQAGKFEQKQLKEWGKAGGHCEPSYDGLMLDIHPRHERGIKVIPPPENMRTFLGMW